MVTEEEFKAFKDLITNIINSFKDDIVASHNTLLRDNDAALKGTMQMASDFKGIASAITQGYQIEIERLSKKYSEDIQNLGNSLTTIKSKLITIEIPPQHAQILHCTKTM
jgi:hypothetical protein